MASLQLGLARRFVAAFEMICLACAFAGCAAETDNGSGGGNAKGGGAGGGNAGMSAITAGSGGTGGSSGSSAGGTGGSAGGISLDCPAISQTAENQVQPVDIIIAIDTSGSMGEEIAFVQQQMNDFSQQIIDSGIDAHVILLATEGKGDSGMAPDTCMTAPWDPACWGSFGDYSVCIGAPLGSGMCPMDSNPPSYTHLNVSVGSNDALQTILDSYPQWKPALREQSVKQFLVISDDNSDPFVPGETPEMTAQTFASKLVALDPSPTMFASWKMNAITCFTDCPASAAIGTVYDALVPMTMGTRGDLCLQDFKPVFDELAKQVAASVSVTCEWDIPTPPMGKQFDRMQTNVKVTIGGSEELIGNVASSADCQDNQAWFYDDPDPAKTPKQVLACPATCSRIQGAPNAKVDVLFDCPTIPVAVE